MAKKVRQYFATDGKLFLCLKPTRTGRFAVTAPFIQDFATEAKTLEEAFAKAKNAATELKALQAKLRRRARVR